MSVYFLVFAVDSEPTEPLSVDGNSSELDMEDLDEEEQDSLRKNAVQTPVPSDPRPGGVSQEALCKPVRPQ